MSIDLWCKRMRVKLKKRSPSRHPPSSQLDSYRHCNQVCTDKESFQQVVIVMMWPQVYLSMLSVVQMCLMLIVVLLCVRLTVVCVCVCMWCWLTCVCNAGCCAGVRKVLKNGDKVMYNLERKINEAVFPGLQGGPHNHQIAGQSLAQSRVWHPCVHQIAGQS